MTKIQVVRAYKDLELGRFVKEGEVFEVSDDRASLLLNKRFVKVIEIVEEKQEKPQIKTKELKTSKKTK